jgi:hypothetical protein
MRQSGCSALLAATILQMRNRRQHRQQSINAGRAYEADAQSCLGIRLCAATGRLSKQEAQLFPILASVPWRCLIHRSRLGAAAQQNWSQPYFVGLGDMIHGAACQLRCIAPSSTALHSAPGEARQLAAAHRWPRPLGPSRPSPPEAHLPPGPPPGCWQRAPRSRAPRGPPPARGPLGRPPRRGAGGP